MREIEDKLNQPSTENVTHTFRAMAEVCQQKYFAPPVYSGTKIIAGMREQEQSSLAREDILLDDGMIVVKEQNTKKLRLRIVPINSRLRPVIERLLKEAALEPGARIFFVKSVDTAFENALDKCGIKNYR